MSLPRILINAARAATVATARRFRHGPLLPGWSFSFEVKAAVFRTTMSHIVTLPAPEQRALMGGMPLAPEPALAQVRREPVSAGGVPGEWFIPKDAPEGGPVFLYFHGGGYVIGSVRSAAPSLAKLAVSCGARVLAIDYRLAPEHPYPAAVDDAVAAYQWLLTSGFPPARITLGGDSAGGGLTVSTLLALRDSGAPLPAGGVLISPWLDLSCTSASCAANAKYDVLPAPENERRWARAYAAGRDLKDARISPLYAEVHGLPPLLIHAGDAECLADDATRFEARARAAGVQVELRMWKEMVHIFQLVGGLTPLAEESFLEMGAFVRKVTARASPTAEAAG
jgi:acetyl esterase/lipase